MAMLRKGQMKTTKGDDRSPGLDHTGRGQTAGRGACRLHAGDPSCFGQARYRDTPATARPAPAQRLPDGSLSKPARPGIQRGARNLRPAANWRTVEHLPRVAGPAHGSGGKRLGDPQCLVN